MIRFIFTLFLLLISISINAQRWTPSDPIGWRLEYSSGTILKFTSNNEPYFEFPGRRGSVNMLTKHWDGAATGTLDITIKITTVDNLIFNLTKNSGSCSNPPAARPWLAVTNWESTTDIEDQWSRWWSRYIFMPLRYAETVNLSVPLLPSFWSNVNGQLGDSSAELSNGFINTIISGGRLGLVFGGGCSYGHGIYVTGGKATLTVLGYNVTL